MSWQHIKLQEISVGERFAYLTQTIVPRPIALASTISKRGEVNLSPFSFFNIFSVEPPVLVFSPSRSVRDNTTKHTLDNILECPEVVIHVVNYSIVQQTSLSSTMYPKGVNEFVKAGFSTLSSTCIRPPRVEEAPVAFECRVEKIVPLGEKGGAGNLVICQVLMMHIQSSLLDEKGTISPQKLDAVARMGEDWYCRVVPESVFYVKKPLTTQGIGIDQLPEEVQTSTILTGNDLGVLGNVEALPSKESLKQFAQSSSGQSFLRKIDQKKGTEAQTFVHTTAQKHLQEGEVEQAWKILLLYIQECVSEK